MGIKERKEREKEARRDEIIDAAEKIFFEKGLAVSTMDEVAEAAELSKGTLYIYYKSKEELALAIVLRGLEIMHKMFTKAVSTGEPTIRLIKNLGEAYYSYFKQYRNYYRMSYIFENPQLHTQVSEAMKDQCSAMDENIWTVVVGLIQRGIDDGTLHKGLDPREAAVILWSNSNGLMRLMDRNEGHWKDRMGIDLESTLRRSNAFLVEAMMTEAAKEEYGSMLLYHEEQTKKN